MIIGQGVHAQDRFEEGGEPAVGNLYGHIVLKGWIFHLIEDMNGIQHNGKLLCTVGTNPSHKQAKGISCHSLVAQMYSLQLDTVPSLALSVKQDGTQLLLYIEQFSMNEIQFLQHAVQLGTLLLQGFLWQEYLLGLYVGLFLAESQEISTLGHLVHRDGEIVVGPLLTEELGTAAEEADGKS